MRNIYNIIIEQKALIDVKMASHDLEYVVEHFSQNQEDYYIQEGLGEGIKNLAKKIIEFIKSVLSKIKELIKKVISFFTGSKSEVQKMEEKIEKAEKGGGSGSKASSGGGSDSKSEKGGGSDSKLIGTKGSNGIKLGLAAPQSEERLKKRAEEREKRQNAKNIDNGVISNSTSSTVGKVGSSVNGGLEKAFKEVKGKMRVRNYPHAEEIFSRFVGISRSVSKYAGSSLEKQTYDEYVGDGSQTSRKELDRFFAESNQEIDKMIGEIGRVAVGYIYNADKIIKKLQEKDKEVEDELNGIMKEILSKEKDGTLNETITTRVQQCVSFLGTYANRCTNVLAYGYSYYIKVAWQVTNAYCNQLDRERNK